MAEETLNQEYEMQEEYRMRFYEARKEAREYAASTVSNAADKLEREIRRAQGVVNSVVALLLVSADELYDILGEFIIAKISLAFSVIPGIGLLLSPAISVSLYIFKFLIGLFITGAVYLYLWRVGLLPKAGTTKRYAMLFGGFIADNLPIINILPINLINVIFMIIDRFRKAQPKKHQVKRLRKEEARILSYNT